MVCILVHPSKLLILKIWIENAFTNVNICSVTVCKCLAAYFISAIAQNTSRNFWTYQRSCSKYMQMFRAQYPVVNIVKMFIHSGQEWSLMLRKKETEDGSDVNMGPGTCYFRKGCSDARMLGASEHARSMLRALAVDICITKLRCVIFIPMAKRRNALFSPSEFLMRDRFCVGMTLTFAPGLE